jgi:hypothetical protein
LTIVSDDRNFIVIACMHFQKYLGQNSATANIGMLNFLVSQAAKHIIV